MSYWLNLEPNTLTLISVEYLFMSVLCSYSCAHWPSLMCIRCTCEVSVPRHESMIYSSCFVYYRICLVLASYLTRYQVFDFFVPTFLLRCLINERWFPEHIGIRRQSTEQLWVLLYVWFCAGSWCELDIKSKRSRERSKFQKTICLRPNPVVFIVFHCFLSSSFSTRGYSSHTPL